MQYADKQRECCSLPKTKMAQNLSLFVFPSDVLKIDNQNVINWLNGAGMMLAVLDRRRDYYGGY